MIKRSLAYALLALIILGLDRFSKFYAVTHWCNAHKVNDYLFFQVSLNRGISWGLLNFDQTSGFIIISSLIGLMTLGLIIYAARRSWQGRAIVGEVCVISGSVSNIIDRFFCHGVIDFIVLHKGQWIWPVFNVADMCIVLGVGLMFIQLIGEHD